MAAAGLLADLLLQIVPQRPLPAAPRRDRTKGSERGEMSVVRGVLVEAGTYTDP